MSRSRLSRTSLPMALLGALVLHGGCAGPGAAGPAAGPPLALEKLRDPGERMLRWAGSGAVVTVLLEPRRYPELRDAILALPELPREVQQALSADNLWTALGRLFAPDGSAWPAPAGWDDARPIAVALFDAPPSDIGDVMQRLFSPAPVAAPLMRHHLLIPATDPQALLQGLTGLLARLPGKIVAPGVFRVQDLTVWLAAGPDHVRLEAELDERRSAALRAIGPGGAAAANAAGPRPAAPLEPDRGPLSPTARMVASSGEALRAYVRPWRLREVNLTQAAKVQAALSSVEPDLRTRILVQGFAELAAGDAVLSAPQGDGDMEDLGLVASVDRQGVRVQAAARLTAVGQRQWAAAQAQAYGARPPGHARTDPAVPAAPTLLRASLGVDLGALLQPGPGDLNYAQVRESFNRVKECGAPCITYVGLRAPLSVLRPMLRKEKEVAALLPRGGAGVIYPRRSGGAPVGAVAMAMSDSTALQDVMRKLSGAPPGALGGKLYASQTPLFGDAVGIALGLDRDPAAVLGGLSQGGGGPLLDVEADLSQLPAEVVQRIGAQWLSQWKTLRLRLALEPGALVAQWGMSRTGAADVALRPGVLGKAAGGGAWVAPYPAASAGAACLRQMVTALSQTCAGVSGVDPSMRATLLGAGARDLEPAQRCAAQDPATRAQAQRLTEGFAQLRQQVAALKD